jgi:uncharacterized protein YbaP (TraB family)
MYGRILVLLYFTSCFNIQVIHCQLLWKIEKPGYPKSYLFGTMHMVPKSKFNFKSQYGSILDSCTQLYEEVLIDELSFSDRVALAQLARLPDGKRLQDMLSESEYKHISNLFLNDVHISTFKWQHLQYLQPIMLESFLMAHCFKPYIIPETYFYKTFNKQSKPCNSLESAHKQMMLISTIPIPLQVQSFETSWQQYKSQCNTMLQLYLNANIEELYKITIQSYTPELIESLLNSRNRSWLSILISNLPRTSCFIAVGAAHLSGSHGLITLLIAQGFTLTPIMPNKNL